MGDSNLSLFEQIKPTNEQVVVTFNPDNSVVSYKYRIIKNNNTDNYISIKNNKAIEILLDETGSYQIEFITTDKYNKNNQFSSGIYNIDLDKPIIKVNESYIEMPKGSKLSIYDGITAYDKQDGSLNSKITSNYDELDFSKIGLKKLVYTVSDSAGNITTATINVNVIKNQQLSLMFVQAGILITLVIIIMFGFSFRRGLKFEKRLSRYSIDPIKGYQMSVFDKILKMISKIIKKISSYLEKSVFITNHSKKFDKYLYIVNNSFQRGLDFISSKLLISLIFIIVAIFANSLQGKILSFHELLIPMIIGYFVPNLIYKISYKNYVSHMENDLLQAIMVMNNAFKSGRSIIQAVELVTKELDGSMAKEFKKMYLELTLGLSIDIVFTRFSERIKIEEASYLTASLTILNKTGGNIVKVFNSIEKSLFNKKKLKLELSSLTGSSRIIVYALISIPILFVSLIALINPTYFVPLYTTTLGAILTGVMLIMYLGYIMVVRKVMKVRM